MADEAFIWNLRVPVALAERINQRQEALKQARDAGLQRSNLLRTLLQRGLDSYEKDEEELVRLRDLLMVKAREALTDKAEAQGAQDTERVTETTGRCQGLTEALRLVNQALLASSGG